MKPVLTRACPCCPFTTASPAGWLGEARARSIIHDITTEDRPFSCHKTTGAATGEDTPPGQWQHCAGAAALLHALGQPNQLMRVAERLHLYDPARLHVPHAFHTPAAFIAHHSGRRRPPEDPCT